MPRITWWSMGRGCRSRRIGATLTSTAFRGDFGQSCWGAGGSNNTFCFRMGHGAFVQGAFTNGLTLEPDAATHGNVAPAQVAPLVTYEADLAATRPDWQEDET